MSDRSESVDIRYGERRGRRFVIYLSLALASIDARASFTPNPKRRERVFLQLWSFIEIRLRYFAR